jgi:hypothetical protein
MSASVEEVLDEDPQIRNTPSEEQSRLETLAYLARCKVLSEEEYKKTQTKGLPIQLYIGIEIPMICTFSDSTS